MEPEESGQERLIPIAQKTLPMYEDMYKVVDFLNKSLKEQYNIMFGLSKNSKDNTVTISIYEF